MDKNTASPSPNKILEKAISCYQAWVGTDPLVDEPNRYYESVFGPMASGLEDASAFLKNLAARISARTAALVAIRIAARVKTQTLYTPGGVSVLKASKPLQELLEVKNNLACLMGACGQWQGEKNAS
jgi:hypothetical protein